MSEDGGRPKLVSVVTPVYNEAPTIEVFHERLTRALAPFAGRYRFEFLLSDNASTVSPPTRTSTRTRFPGLKPERS